MRKLEVYRNNVLTGTLTEQNRTSYIFHYDDKYFNDPKMPVISLTMPKSQQVYQADHLFPFFFNVSVSIHKKDKI